MSTVLTRPGAGRPKSAPRRGLPSRPGATYEVSVATLYRRPVFEDEEAARAVCRVHAATWPWRDARLLAWVLMPECWHGLIVLGERDSLSTLIGRYKALGSRAVADRHRVNGWLWGRGFTERALGEGEDARQVARRLVCLPLRAGLAARLGEYPYWNASWEFAVDEPAPAS